MTSTTAYKHDIRVPPANKGRPPSPEAEATKNAARAEKLRRLARENLSAFNRLVFRGYKTSPHLEALCSLLGQVTLFVESGGTEGIGRAIIEMPPRHGKSLVTSRLYPPWHLGRNPDHRLMLVSYGAELAESNSRAARDLMGEERYGSLWPYVHVSESSRSVAAWDIAYPYRGGVMAVGVGGALTGRGAHILIIDDPIKNREEAESKAYRDRLYREIYQDDLYTRLEPGGAVIVMATRWHMEDLTGQILRDEPDNWYRLKLPALAHANDPLGRAEGEALWPERFSRDYLLALMQANPYRWASLYDQEPVPRSGGMFNYDHIASHRVHQDNVPPLKRIVVAIDPSGAAKGDAVGLVVAGVSHDDHAYILQDATMQGRTEAWARRAIQLYEEYEADCIVAETNFGGDMVRAAVQAQMPFVPFKKLFASRGKDIRAEPISVLYSRGLVHHVGPFPDLEREMVTWVQGQDSPNRLDAMVWAVTDLLMERRGKLRARGKSTL